MTENRQIQQLGAEVLRQQAAPIDDFNSPEFRELIENMRSAMLAANGVGIAAPQLGESKRVVIVASRPTARYPRAPEMAPVVMINPRFDVVDAAMAKDWEGCLSVPGIRALVPRYRAVEVEFCNESGQSCRLTLQDFPARVFQHEFDHLQGLVYLDRVETNRDIVAEAEFFKRMAGQEQAA
ncbi:peptide deformylase [Methylomonas koyamae]|uniref:Peptide deformylase n=1 Tax=Methylomonas koyamae TaxID=702114 RepID=A0A177MXY8_9GAMM|nr:peptide deformylase [Methylomonas koyamae]OAI10502.1 peptide deformylase [Methylomonas koyamae]